MKYTNTYNGLTYWIENGVIYYGNSDITSKARMDLEMFNRMIELGTMVPVKPKVNRDNFFSLVEQAMLENQGFQIRFVAFIAHMGFNYVYSGTVAQRNSRFMSWIADRKADYGQDTITDQDDFTRFIVSGEWL
ncbi:hypothetical protein Motto_57 [Pseudomonas phage Motto]|nr:hypothetical protein Motto_57 [Pseudomonas phage Motto]